MAEVIDKLGYTLTQFTEQMSKIWDWLNQTLWTWQGVSYTPLGLFGIGFIVILGVILIKAIIF